MIKPKIVSIPEKMEKFYGKGQMLHPELHMVIELLDLIPAGKVSTIDDLARKLAITYGADVTCPMRTGNLLKKLAKSDAETPFWRVLKKNLTMVKLDKYERWATILINEGFSLEYTKSDQIKVVVSNDQLFRFSES